MRFVCGLALVLARRPDGLEPDSSQPVSSRMQMVAGLQAADELDKDTIGPGDGAVKVQIDGTGRPHGVKAASNTVPAAQELPGNELVASSMHALQVEGSFIAMDGDSKESGTKKLTLLECCCDDKQKKPDSECGAATSNQLQFRCGFCGLTHCQKKPGSYALQDNQGKHTPLKYPWQCPKSECQEAAKKCDCGRVCGYIPNTCKSTGCEKYDVTIDTGRVGPEEDWGWGPRQFCARQCSKVVAQPAYKNALPAAWKGIKIQCETYTKNEPIPNGPDKFGMPMQSYPIYMGEEWICLIEADDDDA